MVAEVVEADELTFGDIRIPREYVINQQGREYILSDGLLVALGQLSRGFYDVDTAIVQLPTAENAQTAVVTARVVIFEPESGRTLRCASGIGDANPGNVGRLVAGHVLRMAETRAVARSLRHLLGVGMTALEELGGSAPADEHAGQDTPSTSYTPRSPSFPSPAGPRPIETIQIDGRTFTRSQVLSVYDDRLAEAQRVGLQLAPVGSQGGPPRRDAPLQELVDFSAALKRRLEARAGAARSSGK
jgi:hypothetical protein